MPQSANRRALPHSRQLCKHPMVGGGKRGGTRGAQAKDTTWRNRQRLKDWAKHRWTRRGDPGQPLRMWSKDSKGELQHSWQSIGAAYPCSRLCYLCNAVWTLAIGLQIDQSVGRWVSDYLVLAKLLVVVGC